MARSDTKGRPAIAIDPIKNLIRIHKTTLHMLGTPDFIQLMVNPKTMQIAIKPCEKRDNCAHKIRWHEIEGRKSYHLQSQALLQELFKFENNFDKNKIYRIYGDYFEKENVARFDFKDATCEKVVVINNG